MHRFVSRIAFGIFLFFFLALCGPAVFAATDAQDQAARAPGGDLGLEQLLRERVAAARAFFEATKAAYEKETVTHDQYVLAIREQRAAELDAATTPKERVTAHVRAVAAMRALETQVKALFEAGARGGEADKHSHSKEARLEAEIRLTQERQHAEKPQRPADGADRAAEDQDARGASARLEQTIAAELAQLRRQRLDAARMFVEATRAAFETDTVTIDILILANRELFDAELEAAKAPAERMAACTRAAESARALEEKIKALFDAGARGGEAEKLAQSRSARLEADIRLLGERQRQAGAGKALPQE